jgi:endonuclease YncB( thermonuclease family)
MRPRIIAMSVLAALIMAALALPAGAHNTNNDAVGSQTKHRPSMGPGGKLTLALLKKGESQSLADVYAREDTGEKVKRAMRRGLYAHCHPQKRDFSTFTCARRTTTPPTVTTPPPATTAQVAVKVTRVIDGDTIEISPLIDGTQDVRLIGVDTPETYGGEEPCGPEASNFTTSSLEGRQVRLEFDEDMYDPYGRLLAYVWMPDGTMFNEVLVEEGYASVSTYPPNDKYEQRFIAAEATAPTLACSAPANRYR